MPFVHIVLDESTDKIIVGQYSFNRDAGGTLAIPSGTSFPGTPVAKELFWREDESTLYRRNNANDAWEGVAGLTAATHKALRDLIHFLPDGPGDGFASLAYREILPAASPFPTNVVWYEDSTKAKKIFEKTLTYSGTFPTTIAWSVYDTDGTSILATASDAITYSGPFETARTRTITVA